MTLPYRNSPLNCNIRPTHFEGFYTDRVLHFWQTPGQKRENRPNFYQGGVFMKPTIPTDPQCCREKRCALCGSCVYPPRYRCIRCERSKP